MPTPSLVGVGAALTFNSTTAATHGFTVPGAYQTDDIALLFLSNFSTGAVTVPGWTLLGSHAPTGSAFTSQRVYYRVLTTGETSSWSFTIDTGHIPAYAHVRVFRWVADPPLVTFTDGTTGTATTPTVTPSFNDSPLVAYWAVGNNQTPTVDPDLVSVVTATGGRFIVGHEIRPNTTATSYSTTLSPTPPYWGAAVVELQPFNRNPYKATLVRPANGAAADMATAGSVSEWVHSDPDGPGDTQTAVRFKRLLAGGSNEWWTGAAWAGVETDWVTTAQSKTWAAAAWANGEQYQWWVATRDILGLWGPYSDPSIVITATTPVVSLTLPDPVVTDTTSPQIAWAFTQAETNPQVAYEVKVFTAAQVAATAFTPETSASAWTSGVVNSADALIDVGTDLENGGTYTVYVRAAQAGGLWAPWDSTVFAIAVEAPATPTIAVTPQVPAVYPATPSPLDAGVYAPRALVEVSGHHNVLTEEQAQASDLAWEARTNVASLTWDDVTDTLTIEATAAGTMEIQSSDLIDVAGGRTWTLLNEAAFVDATGTPLDVEIVAIGYNDQGEEVGQFAVAATEATTDPNPPPVDPDPVLGLVTMYVSANADRTAGTAIADTQTVDIPNPTVSGAVAVFVDPPTNVGQVWWWLDDPTGSGTPDFVDTVPPFDFAGGSGALAVLFDTAELDATGELVYPNGTHTFTARLFPNNGAAPVTLTGGVTFRNSPGPQITAVSLTPNQQLYTGAGQFVSVAASDPLGDPIASYAWSWDTGTAASPTLGNPTTPITGFTATSTSGDYKLKVAVTDSGGRVAEAKITIPVLPAITVPGNLKWLPPTLNATQTIHVAINDTTTQYSQPALPATWTYADVVVHFGTGATTWTGATPAGFTPKRVTKGWQVFGNDRIRHVHVISGETFINAFMLDDPNWYNTVTNPDGTKTTTLAIPPNTGTNKYVPYMGARIVGCTGTAYLEGVLFHGRIDAASDKGSICEGIQFSPGSGGQSRLVVQNCRVERISGADETPGDVTGKFAMGSNNHADCIQLLARNNNKIVEVAIDHFTGTTSWCGFTLFSTGTPNAGVIWISNTNTRDDGRGYSKQQLEYGNSATSGTDKLRVEDGTYWIKPGPRRVSTTPDWLIDNYGNGTVTYDAANNNYLPNDAIARNWTDTGGAKIKKGDPPGGDYCPTGTPGMGYVSPGYMTGATEL